jgi:ribosomal protein S18 acetylase RimI-like enzyme
MAIVPAPCATPSGLPTLRGDASDAGRRGMSALRLPAPLLPGDGFRVTPWRVDPGLVHLSLMANRRRPVTRDELRQLLVSLRLEGWQGVVTAALAPVDQEAFLDQGFRVVERLHLLRHRLASLPSRDGPDQPTGPDRPGRPDRPAPAGGPDGADPERPDRPEHPPAPSPPGRHPRHLRHSPARRTRRARRRDHPAVLAIDRAAFVPFWQLDQSTLAEALTATHSTRFRVVDGAGGRVAGYAVCGRSAARGYVQRLAVEPGHQHQGLGTALLLDGLRWLARRRARDVLVNTQEGNQRSLRLYLRTGFELEPGGLAVLRLDFRS